MYGSRERLWEKCYRIEEQVQESEETKDIEECRWHRINILKVVKPPQSTGIRARSTSMAVLWLGKLNGRPDNPQQTYLAMCGVAWAVGLFQGTCKSIDWEREAEKNVTNYDRQQQMLITLFRGDSDLERVKNGGCCIFTHKYMVLAQSLARVSFHC